MVALAGKSRSVQDRGRSRRALGANASRALAQDLRSTISGSIDQERIRNSQRGAGEFLAGVGRELRNGSRNERISTKVDLTAGRSFPVQNCSHSGTWSPAPRNDQSFHRNGTTHPTRLTSFPALFAGSRQVCWQLVLACSRHSSFPPGNSTLLFWPVKAVRRSGKSLLPGSRRGNSGGQLLSAAVTCPYSPRQSRPAAEFARRRIACGSFEMSYGGWSWMVA